MRVYVRWGPLRLVARRRVRGRLVGARAALGAGREHRDAARRAGTRSRTRGSKGERPAARAPAQALSADVGRWWANVEDEESCASYSTIQHTCPS